MKVRKPKKAKKDVKHREELTFKQQNFVYFFIKNGGNATQATIDAKYSPKNANKMASQLMHLPAVKREIDKSRHVIEKKSITTFEDRERKLWDIAASSDSHAAIKAIDIINKMKGDYAPIKTEVDTRNLNINATMEVKEVQEVRKEYERDI